MTRTGEQLLARFFIPLSSPAGFTRLARSSLFLILIHDIPPSLCSFFIRLTKNHLPFSLFLYSLPPLSQ